jgi:phosphoribosylamine--glycine ligase/phosphoribosylformylglycinamidine cyclo-ligase
MVRYLTFFLTELLKLMYSYLGVEVFHAGTSAKGEELVTSGGRVLAVTAYAPSIKQALELAYDGVEKIEFEGKTFRGDIGHR